MSARSLIFWAIAGFMALTAAMMLVPREVPVASLETGLGPEVTTSSL